MGSYSIIYRGPSLEEDPDRARRIAEGIALRLPISVEDALARLGRTPFPLINETTHGEAMRQKIFLSALGASLEVVPSGLPAAAPAGGASAAPVYRPRRRHLRFAWRALGSALLPSLAVCLLIVCAGALMFLLPDEVVQGRLRGMPSRDLGLALMALALVMFLVALLLRVPQIRRIVAAPDHSSPLGLLRSFLAALRFRNWGAALACLAARPDSSDLGSGGWREALDGLKSLTRWFELSDDVDAASISFATFSRNFLELRFHIGLASRRPVAEGHHLQLRYLDSRRFQRIGGRWYMLDGYLLGQADPARLPKPACRECRAEFDPGVEICASCRAKLPPLAEISREWSKPPGGAGWRLAAGAAAVAVLVAASAFLFFALTAGVPWLEPFFQPDSTISGAEPGGRPLFHSSDGRFIARFPPRWQVSEEKGTDGRSQVVCQSDDESAAIRLSSIYLGGPWEPCPEAQAKRIKLEVEEAATVAKLECGSGVVGLQYRIDYYDSDMLWRKTLLVIKIESELFVITFVCPFGRQAEFVSSFESVVSRLELILVESEQ